MSAVANPPRSDGDPTEKRDVRGAEQTMSVWPIAPNMWRVGSGGGSEYSECVVDLREGRCTCSDWQYRGEPGSGEIARCKHASRVLQALGRIKTPTECQADPALEYQRERLSR
jgi:hypothetical protein